MSHVVESRWGGTENHVSESRMREILEELEVDDLEHPDVTLQHESGWGLSAYQENLLVWENVEDSVFAPRHMIDVSREEVLRLWRMLTEGRIADIDAEAWLPGYGSTP